MKNMKAFNYAKSRNLGKVLKTSDANSFGDEHIIKVGDHITFPNFDKIIEKMFTYDKKENIREFKILSQGIPDELKEGIFNRAIIKKRSVFGMGLGLSIIKRIIQGYRGKIWVEDKVPSDYSKGAILNILIPKA